jgi:hypothetical protein
VLNRIIELCYVAVAVDKAFILMHDKTAKELVSVVHTGVNYRSDGYFRLTLDEASRGVPAFNEGCTVAVENATHDLRVSPRMREKFGVQSSPTAPLKLRPVVVGALMATTYSPRAYTKRDIVVFEALVREATFALHVQDMREARLLAERENRAKERA